MSSMRLSVSMKAGASEGCPRAPHLAAAALYHPLTSKAFFTSSQATRPFSHQTPTTSNRARRSCRRCSATKCARRADDLPLLALVHRLERACRRPRRAASSPRRTRPCARRARPGRPRRAATGSCAPGSRSAGGAGTPPRPSRPRRRALFASPSSADTRRGSCVGCIGRCRRTAKGVAGERVSRCAGEPVRQ